MTTQPTPNEPSTTTTTAPTTTKGSTTMTDQQITAYYCATQAAAALDRANANDVSTEYVHNQLGVAEGWRHLAQTIAGSPGTVSPIAADA